MDSKALHEGYLLKNSEYRIISSLGQGGFGITYLAEQLSLSRKVAIKEFFMKENCNRDENTSEVSVPSVGSRELVAKFRQKFLREARMIAKLDNLHIVKIHDVFEENGTAYYVMEYLDGGSLVDEVKHRGPMSEQKALGYIRQIASALDYLHGMNVLHFDIKPANILIGNAGQAMLIDFGISKHYDAGGSQTSSTPVGISNGYAPLEQYQQGEISTFTPATDIYALGATLYYLLLGQTPPSASEVNEEGGVALPAHLSASVRKAIEKAMAPRRRDRPQSVQEFLSLLDGGRTVASEVPEADEETKVNTGFKRDSSSVPVSSSPKRNYHIGLWIALCSFIGIGVLSFLLLMQGKTSAPIPPAVPTGTLKISSIPSGAVLWLDGKNMEKSTPLTVENLSSGVHKVVLKLDGYEDGVKEVAVSSSAHMDCNITLKKKVSSVEPPVVQSGTLKVSSTPSGASIWIDGKNTGKTTPKVLEDLSAGKHAVVLRLSGYQEFSKSVSVISSQRSDCHVDLVKEPEVVRTGTLKVSSTPSGASIWIDGKNTGKTTPEILEDIAVGSHKIVLKHDGYQDVAMQVSVSSGKRTECTVTLDEVTEPVKPSPPQNYTETALGVNMKMVYVASGSFMMGATSEQGSNAFDYEKPVHQVVLSGYYIGAYEVTQGQWEKVMGTSVTQQRDKANSSWPLYGVGSDYPMYYVSWDEAQAFCRELSRRTGKRYVLPTEAQWEYAARGGNRNEGTKYSGSDAVDVVVWYDSNSGSSTHPVGTKRPNALGLYDMSGNVWEWCADWYGSYPNMYQANPTGPSSGSRRVYRGGSWFNSAAGSRVSNRNDGTPSRRDGHRGFRVVCLP
ncbi:SUMF1/EgtB/PvdO family nonheme iron enzyme [Odoribacter lunatus]|uniref:SUMF1/EgtB/PvdO family nonheme iron enzyme n=1 Tax=Odoribacter lunatus TaxID=2941335 RepID=UPI002040B5CB|nr:SUMF1/EgtB/PvdO family nonheme iron enzyme [Odoribacter lunatus]